MNPYRWLARLLPTRSTLSAPHRIILIQPCCIGDVILATAALKALRRAYPHAHITWAVGSWSRPAVEAHDLLDEIQDTGIEALPVKSPGVFWHFLQQLRTGKYDLAVSFVRSPLMSLAVLLSGIPCRAGINSNGRGFGYNLRTTVDPHHSRHEAEIYLDVVRSLGVDTAGCYANVPVSEAAVNRVKTLLTEQNIRENFIVINPAGGNNPGMVMDSKRWLPENFAALADRLAARLGIDVVIVAGPKDGEIVDAVRRQMQTPAVAFIGELTFSEIAALASLAQVYIGNDTGLTHLAAAAGVKTAMILGPSDPRRYAPFAPNAIALWRPVSLNTGGVVTGMPSDWDWSRNGISVDDVYDQVLTFLQSLM